jgi:membrane-bound serine protease (ClpP class)
VRFGCAAIAAVTGIMLSLSPAASARANEIWLVELDGAIGPASADYLIRALEDAQSADAALLVVRMDTPGGLDKAMRSIIKAILASSVPVATYVAPSGSRAASAGTYILYASHIAAMAPSTNVGSSTPVSIGGPTPGAPADTPPGDEGREDGDGEPARPPGPRTAMERKIVNDAAAYIRGLAELRGRNAEWAEESVREAASLTASAALEMRVIDVVATDLDALLAELEGRSVTVQGEPRTITLKGAEIVRVSPDWRHELLALITDPNVAYLLLLFGIYGLLFELYNPGLGLPGIVGAICLLLGAFALQLLPVDYAGLGLLLLGIGLMVAEAMSPSFGVLGAGGVIAFVLGSIMLMDTELPGYRVSLPLIAGVAVASVGFVVFALGAVLRARREPIASGAAAMVGTTAVAITDFDDAGRGKVRVFGEIWDATSRRPLVRGATVRVVAIEGLLLEVEPAT